MKVFTILIIQLKRVLAWLSVVNRIMADKPVGAVQMEEESPSEGTEEPEGDPMEEQQADLESEPESGDTQSSDQSGRVEQTPTQTSRVNTPEAAYGPKIRSTPIDLSAYLTGSAPAGMSQPAQLPAESPAGQKPVQRAPAGLIQPALEETAGRLQAAAMLPLPPMGPDEGDGLEEGEVDPRAEESLSLSQRMDGSVWEIGPRPDSGKDPELLTNKQPPGASREAADAKPAHKIPPARKREAAGKRPMRPAGRKPARAAGRGPASSIPPAGRQEALPSVRREAFIKTPALGAGGNRPVGLADPSNWVCPGCMIPFPKDDYNNRFHYGSCQLYQIYLCPVDGCGNTADRPTLMKRHCRENHPGYKIGQWDQPIKLGLRTIFLWDLGTGVERLTMEAGRFGYHDAGMRRMATRTGFTNPPTAVAPIPLGQAFQDYPRLRDNLKRLAMGYKAMPQDRGTPRHPSGSSHRGGSGSAQSTASSRSQGESPIKRKRPDTSSGEEGLLAESQQKRRQGKRPKTITRETQDMAEIALSKWLKKATCSLGQKRAYDEVFGTSWGREWIRKRARAKWGPAGVPVYTQQVSAGTSAYLPRTEGVRPILQVSAFPVEERPRTQSAAMETPSAPPALAPPEESRLRRPRSQSRAATRPTTSAARSQPAPPAGQGPINPLVMTPAPVGFQPAAALVHMPPAASPRPEQQCDQERKAADSAGADSSGEAPTKRLKGRKEGPFVDFTEPLPPTPIRRKARSGSPWRVTAPGRAVIPVVRGPHIPAAPGQQAPAAGRQQASAASGPSTKTKEVTQEEMALLKIGPAQITNVDELSEFLEEYLSKMEDAYPEWVQEQFVYLSPPIRNDANIVAVYHHLFQKMRELSLAKDADIKALMTPLTAGHGPFAAGLTPYKHLQQDRSQPMQVERLPHDWDAMTRMGKAAPADWIPEGTDPLGPPIPIRQRRDRSLGAERPLCRAPKTTEKERLSLGTSKGPWQTNAPEEETQDYRHQSRKERKQRLARPVEPTVPSHLPAAGRQQAAGGSGTAPAQRHGVLIETSVETSVIPFVQELSRRAVVCSRLRRYSDFEIQPGSYILYRRPGMASTIGPFNIPIPTEAVVNFTKTVWATNAVVGAVPIGPAGTWEPIMMDYSEGDNEGTEDQPPPTAESDGKHGSPAPSTTQEERPAEHQPEGSMQSLDSDSMDVSTAPNPMDTAFLELAYSDVTEETERASDASITAEDVARLASDCSEVMEAVAVEQVVRLAVALAASQELDQMVPPTLPITMAVVVRQDQPAENTRGPPARNLRSADQTPATK